MRLLKRHWHNIHVLLGGSGHPGRHGVQSDVFKRLRRSAGPRVQPHSLDALPRLLRVRRRASEEIWCERVDKIVPHCDRSPTQSRRTLLSHARPCSIRSLCRAASCASSAASNRGSSAWQAVGGGGGPIGGGGARSTAWSLRCFFVRDMSGTRTRLEGAMSDGEMTIMSLSEGAGDMSKEDC